MTLLDNPTPTTLSVNGADLVWLLRAVLPHAGTDRSLPILCHAQIQVRPGTVTLPGIGSAPPVVTPGRVILIATDRYTAVRAEIHAKTEQTFDGMIYRSWLDDLAAFAAKHAKGAGTEVALDLDDERLIARPTWYGGFYEAPSRTYPMPRNVGEFPKIGPIMRGALDRTEEPATFLGLNLALTAKFQHAQPHRHDAASVKGSTPTKPLIVAYGEPGAARRFLGLQMPVCFTEGGTKPFEGWDL